MYNPTTMCCCPEPPSITYRDKRLIPCGHLLYSRPILDRKFTKYCLILQFTKFVSTIHLYLNFTPQYSVFSILLRFSQLNTTYFSVCTVPSVGFLTTHILHFCTSLQGHCTVLVNIDQQLHDNIPNTHLPKLVIQKVFRNK